MTIEGMGHDLPRAAWPRIVDGIVDNAGAPDSPPSPERPSRWPHRGVRLPEPALTCGP